MFQSLGIQHFRGFANLALGGVGRVNLIVGKNNTGKTSLLEALTLLADPTMIARLPGLFRCGADAAEERFFRWLPRDEAKGTEIILTASEAGTEGRQVLLRADGRSMPEPFVHLGTFGALHVWGRGDKHPLPLRAVSSEHQAPETLIDAFADAVRSPQDERQLEMLLTAVDPRVRTVRLDSVKSRPAIVVDVGLSERIPLSQAGQGIYRLVAIFSELLGRKPRVCFIDEIEHGIHHSALPSVWAGIAEVASRLDIQVFATTHSWECLVAAHEAFASRGLYDFRVLQLYRLGEAISGRVLDRDHIEAAIAGKIELR
jgi:hypothetical protein